MFTHLGANKILQGFLTNNPTLYVGAFLVAPTVIGGGTEVATSSYERLEVDSSLFLAPSNSSTANTTILEFVEPEEIWGDIVAFGLFDASNVLLAFKEISKYVGPGDRLRIPVGNLLFRNN